jgi:Rrf2 family protein
MFSQTTEYAMRAMACLAIKPDTLVPTPDLAKQTHVPMNYLAKVLQQLAAANLIYGRRGVGGGYRLARHASEITLLDVINAVSSLRRISNSPIDDHTAPHLSALHRKADEAADAVTTIFKSVSLQDLVDEGGSTSAAYAKGSQDAPAASNGRGSSGHF